MSESADARIEFTAVAMVRCWSQIEKLRYTSRWAEGDEAVQFEIELTRESQLPTTPPCNWSARLDASGTSLEQHAEIYVYLQVERSLPYPPLMPQYAWTSHMQSLYRNAPSACSRLCFSP